MHLWRHASLHSFIFIEDLVCGNTVPSAEIHWWDRHGLYLHGTIVQLPDRSTFYHPRKKNLSRLFKKTIVLQRSHNFSISPKSSHLLVKQSTLSWILIISVAQIFPSKPININIVSKGTWLTTDSTISVLRYSWFTEPSSNWYISFG